MILTQMSVRSSITHSRSTLNSSGARYEMVQRWAAQSCGIKQGGKIKLKSGKNVEKYLNSYLKQIALVAIGEE